jgi:hypothetical protein
MSDTALAQVILIAVALALTIGIVAGAVAVITILRRRRMSTPDAKPPQPTVIQSPPPPLPAPAPEPAAPVVEEKPIIEPIVLDPSEPTSITIEPDAGPTARERHVQRLIDHFKSDGDTPAEPDDSESSPLT